MAEIQAKLMIAKTDRHQVAKKVTVIAKYGLSILITSKSMLRTSAPIDMVQKQMGGQC